MFRHFLVHVDSAGHELCVTGCPLSKTIGDGVRREVELYLRHKDGHRVPVCVGTSPIRAVDGAILGAVEVFTNITAMKQLQRQAGELKDLAYRDVLTGVANRRYIEVRVQQAIQDLECFGRDHGLVLIDVDGFKAINDTYGHQTGDDCLKAICNTLKNSRRPGDIVARWGGEDFLLLARDVSSASLARWAERCQHLVGQTSVQVGGQRIRMSISLGATLLKRGDSCSMAVGRADRLIYAGKRAGGNLMQFG